MKNLTFLISLLSFFTFLSGNNNNFHNINIKTILYELIYDDLPNIKIIILTQNIIINDDIKFKAYLKSIFNKIEYILECKIINNIIECYILDSNYKLDIKYKYYFFYNLSDYYNLTLNYSKIFKDKNRISLIFKPEILKNQILYTNKKKFLVKTNKEIINNGYLYAVRKNKKILKCPKDGFNKFIELKNYISHAGLSGYRPQSSLIAYKEAIRRGFKIVDADIQFTKDKIPIVCHGKVLEHISNAKGFLTLKTLKEIKNIDFGNKEFKNITIITFEELLKLCKENNIIIDLDLFHMDFNKYFKETDEYAKIIINTIKKYNYFDSIIFNSGHNIEKISILKKIKNDIVISIDDMNKRQNIDKMKDKFNDSKRVIYNMGNLLFGNNIDEKTVKYGLSLGHKIKAAKVNDLVFANKIFNWGVNYITTQYLHPFLVENEKEEPIKLKCTSLLFDDKFSECKFDENVNLIDNEIYNIYYSEDIYNLSNNINEIPIGQFKYLNTNNDNKLFYSVKYLNFTQGIVQLYISNRINKKKILKGIIGPAYDNVAKCYQYNFFCEGMKKYLVNCKIIKNELDKIEFKGNYSIYYLENYTLNNAEIESLMFSIIQKKNCFFIILNIIIILLIIKFIIKKKPLK